MSIFISACGTVDRAFQCPSTANLACQQRNSAPPNQEFPLLGRQSPKSDKANKTGGLDALSLETVPLYDPYDGLLPSNSFHRLANSTAVYSMSACFRHTNLPHRPHAKLGAPLVKLHKKSPGKSSVVPTVRVDGFQIKPLSL
jgi:hypothetical protein